MGEVRGSPPLSTMKLRSLDDIMEYLLSNTSTYVPSFTSVSVSWPWEPALSNLMISSPPSMPQPSEYFPGGKKKTPNLMSLPPSMKNSQPKYMPALVCTGILWSSRALTLTAVKEAPVLLMRSPMLQGDSPPRKVGMNFAGMREARSSCIGLFVMMIFLRVRSLRAPFTAFHSPEKMVGAFRMYSLLRLSGNLLWPMPKRETRRRMQELCRCRAPKPFRSNTSTEPRSSCWEYDAPASAACNPLSRWKCHHASISSLEF
mmetsp:Transcript_6330/g.12545  ORF Transcript_6330/g.12545 Transcript_6330/m.12545 type:complete len:259 (-) Transcript_6330:496-1272(-)